MPGIANLKTNKGPCPDGCGIYASLTKPASDGTFHAKGCAKKGCKKCAAPLRKAAREQRGWAKANNEVKKRSGGKCEARIPGICTGIGQQTHHRLNRSQGGKADPALLLRVCLACHARIGDHPADAYALGLLLHRWDVRG